MGLIEGIICKGKDLIINFSAASLSMPFAIQPLIFLAGLPNRNAFRSFATSFAFFLLMARRNISRLPQGIAGKLLKYLMTCS